MPNAERHHQLSFRLPLPGFPRAIFQTSYGYRGGELLVDGAVVLAAASREALEQGVEGHLGASAVSLRLAGTDLELRADGELAPLEETLRAPPSRSAWLHASIALAASAAGYAAGWLYLQKADLLASPWAAKMGYHTAAWHLLLTFTLFPASVWGQRIGIRAVQLVSVIFACIHAGIAIANAGWPDAGSHHDGWIAALNAISGVLFVASVAYGNTAHRDMDPVAALARSTR